MIVIFSFPIRNLCHLSFGFDCIFCVEIFKQFNSIKLLVGGCRCGQGGCVWGRCLKSLSTLHTVQYLTFLLIL